MIVLSPIQRSILAPSAATAPSLSPCWLAHTLPAPYHRCGQLLEQKHTYEQISALLDCPLGTVRSRLHRARVLIRKRLETRRSASFGTTEQGVFQMTHLILPVGTQDHTLRAKKGRSMKGISVLVFAAMTPCAIAAIPFATGRAHDTASPIFVTKIPRGYRDWKLISVAREEGDLNDIRAILGNDKAIKAYREGKLPFPDGAIIARLAWSHDPSEENNKTFGRPQSFVAGSPKNGVQFMVKDSKKYAATGGWGYAHFNDGKPAEEAVLKTCFPCHQAIKSRDFVFTRYAH